MKKLNCIMLVDDNSHDNFFHERVIRKSNAVERVVIHVSAEDALSYLKSTPAGTPEYPDLIFLDINMPRMNGWDFLDEFRRLETEKQSTAVIVMLTTSSNPDDELKAQMAGIVTDFQSKPLTKGMLDKILRRFFGGGDSPIDKRS